MCVKYSHLSWPSKTIECEHVADERGNRWIFRLHASVDVGVDVGVYSFVRRFFVRCTVMGASFQRWNSLSLVDSCLVEHAMVKRQYPENSSGCSMWCCMCVLANDEDRLPFKTSL